MALKSPLSGVKGLLRSGASHAYYASGHHRRANLGQFVILMYHRVLPDGDPYIPYIQPGMYVRASSFEKQLEFLTDAYQIVSLQEMLELIETGRASSERQYCVITFDDGWRDNYQYAFPLLKKFSAPATIFLTASFVGTHRLFWHEKVSKLFYLARSSGKQPAPSAHESDAAGSLLMRHLFSAEGTATAVDTAIEGLKSLPVAQIEEVVERVAARLGISFENERTMLSWEEIREMGKSGISFGSHTCEHRILTQIDLATAAEEITGSMTQLRSREPDLNYVPVFCYPNGRYNEQIRSLVIEAGYSAAVTTKLGRQSRELTDPFAIARIGVHDDIAHSKSLFSLRLR
ncbi:polysaccharide deacetylase family protein [Steroidobacter agaridevorans]|uniref:polysaccharide deacetylase family protein n=1 Tax=Steroidobacter agaridevorans TaxID=2695856 RepID=UPI001322BA76|nr:polysaccharide deacetylase family protein [Steroidobacter agaridevorans]GFE85456.1 polysaccharide deacetylase [Steroidobacter agaridevorans]